MARIEGIRIKNYRVLGDITLGKLWNTRASQPLSPLTVVIGKNGVGKSSLFDAFGFLADCLKLGVEEACDTRGAVASTESARRVERHRSSLKSITDRIRRLVPLLTNLRSIRTIPAARTSRVNACGSAAEVSDMVALFHF